MTTVTHARAVVKPEHSNTVAGMLDLYDWLRFRTLRERIRRVEELQPPVSKYEQLADALRRRIFDGDFPQPASGPTIAKRYKVSPPVAQRAFELLAREGLLRMETGKRTSVAERQPWTVSFDVRLPLDEKARGAALTQTRERLAELRQPAITEAEAQRGSYGITLMMTVESASLPGAVTAALTVARQLLGPLPIAVMSAGEYPRF